MVETKIIKKDLETYKFLKSRATNAFSKSNYEQALDFIYLAATLAWNSHLGIWYDNELEYLLSEIGKHIISDEKRRDFKKERKNGGNTKKIAYIATQLYDTGGHSRVLKQWTNLLSDSYEQYLYISNASNTPNYSPYILNSLKSNRVVVKQLPWCDNYVDRIKKLNEWIETEAPDIIILFIHPNDVIAVSSLLSCTNKPYTIFFNHADHVFWLGRNAIDLLVEWRSEGAKISKKFRKVNNRVVIPLTIDIKPKKVSTTTYGIPETVTVSVSIGSFYKVLGNGETNYFDTIRKLLEKFPNHYHLLVTVPPSPKVLKKYLPDDQDLRRRLIVTGPFTNLGPVYGVADFLIETFPLAGGSVRSEAMACKLPIVAFRNKKVPILTEMDALPSNYPFVAYTTKDVIEYSSEFIQNSELRSEVGNWLYEYYKQNFSPEKIRQLLISIITKKDGGYILSDIQHINTGQLDYDINHMRLVLTGGNKFLMNRKLLLQSILKRSKFSLRERIRFYINSLKNNEFKSRKEIIGGIILAIFGWRGASSYFLSKNKGKGVKKWLVKK